MKEAPAATPVLKQFAGFWTLERQPSEAKEWSLEEKIRQAKKARFDALGGHTMPEVVPLCEKYGMKYVCYLDGNKNYPRRLKEAQAEKMGLNLDLEVHRDTCTETPEKTYEIADLYQKATGRKIRFCFDFSHIAVVKHLFPPYAPRLLVRPDLVQLSRQVHFRPFNGHHAQIPATDGKGRETPEFQHYLEFVDAFLACWLKGAKGGEILYACPEFGPVASGYGVSTFPNVWKDAVLLRERTEAIWKKNLRRWKAGRS